LASNSYGRIEIHHGRLCARVFHSFQHPPTEPELIGFFREFSENFLIFLYACAGQTWGQWDTDKRFLPRHHTKSDDRSPAPPEEALNEWKQKHLGSREVTVVQDFGKLPKSLENFGEKVRGVGVGGGVGKTKTSSTPELDSYQAAAGYCDEFNVVGHPAVERVRKAIELQIKKHPEETPQSVAEYMIEQRRKYLKMSGVVFEWTADSFIAKGTWLNENMWRNGSTAAKDAQVGAHV
jgi:hypothetical protein